ncbi:MAG: chemotaxis protein CheD [Limnochordia bacterium]|jgi:chemotaxis protein CheD|nr:chemotaxis protein CheD [Limnochordia bacterium]MDD2628645.1 chemotaxis protein CheD [Limnochordia bacterium]MDD4516938.1 chemotaxis protein CheD [Limnochordia bacterium]
MEHLVGLGEYAIVKELGIIKTLGLGSCVGVALYDSINRVAGLSHIFLASANGREKHENPGKYADLALPLLYKQMLQQGAHPRTLYAKIAGGGQLFSGMEGPLLNVGEQNVLAVQTKLKELGVKVSGQDVGGNKGRSMSIDVATGLVIVNKAGEITTL